MFGDRSKSRIKSTNRWSAARPETWTAWWRRELSVPEQLEKLSDLRDKGVLTQAEFDAKKAQLLEKM